MFEQVAPNKPIKPQKAYL